MNLDRYIDKALEHYKSAYGKLDDLVREEKAAKEAYKKESQRLTNEAAREMYEGIVKDFRTKREAITKELNDSVATIEAEYLREVKAFYTPNGADINAEDQALLASGILSVDEVAEMILRHAENPTMQRVIKKYVGDNHIDNLPGEAAVALNKANMGGEAEQRIFNKFKQLVNTPVALANEGYGGTEGFMTSALKADDYAYTIKIELLESKIALSDSEKAEVGRAKAAAIEKANQRFFGNKLDASH